MSGLEHKAFLSSLQVKMHATTINMDYSINHSYSYLKYSLILSLIHLGLVSLCYLVVYSPNSFTWNAHQPDANQNSVPGDLIWSEVHKTLHVLILDLLPISSRPRKSRRGSRRPCRQVTLGKWIRSGSQSHKPMAGQTGFIPSASLPNQNSLCFRTAQ